MNISCYLCLAVCEMFIDIYYLFINLHIQYSVGAGPFISETSCLAATVNIIYI